VHVRLLGVFLSRRIRTKATADMCRYLLKVNVIPNQVFRKVGVFGMRMEEDILLLETFVILTDF
jgi:hypothetical protein